MHLKRLELKGFKSFPTKTEINFNEGITAIVGPNGSGKSNISDAVRWVLGEQSIKSLRGDKLEDVIFAGTIDKKPMNYCEVALTIDNSDEKLNIDFSEVTIKRRAYRNGESGFFLNDKACRLKDIKELLLDTGIGKDGYSIIEQGKVDEILSNNPANRRKVFDEACGISKYRYKKQEAEKNLKNTKENLERIEDVYIEIENRIKPLFSQQKKALRYLELRENLKKLEVNNYIREIKKIDNELSEITKIDKSKISSYMSGRYKAKTDGLKLIADALNVSPVWLMGYDVPMERQELENNVFPIDDMPKKVPVVGRISAGLPMLATENIEGYEFAPSSQLKDGYTYFYLKVQGDSMNLKFNEGDIVLVQKQDDLENNEIGVILVNGDDATVKKYRKENGLVILEPMSTNPENVVQIYNPKDIQIRIIGKVISYQGKI